MLRDPGAAGRPRASSGEDTAQRLTAVAEGFGLPQVTAERLVAVGAAIRALAGRDGREFAVSLDRETAAPAGPLLGGAAHEVDIADQLHAMKPGHQYVSLHTHASSAAFSDWDVDVLLRNSPLDTIVAVGADGTWYFLGKRPRARHMAEHRRTARLAV